MHLSFPYVTLSTGRKLQFLHMRMFATSALEPNDIRMSNAWKPWSQHTAGQKGGTDKYENVCRGNLNNWSYLKWWTFRAFLVDISLTI